MEVSYDKSKVKVLIVDDESSIREMLAITLQEDGWSVDVAANGREAAERVIAEKFHIVMSDINMPEMTGIELLQFVKEKRPMTEFVIMTSNATLDTAVQAVKLGAYDYLHKPFDDLNVVTQKISLVADKILLRQQNQELMNRLKIASQDLRRLVSSMILLSGILDFEELRSTCIQNLPVLFGDKDLKASWWSFEENRWVLKNATPSITSFEGLQIVNGELQSEYKLKDMKLHFFEYQDSKADAIVIEDRKETLAKLFLNQLSLCYQKVLFHREIASLANKDGLTKIYNHRYFQERLQQELAIAQRQSGEVSLLLMDVDHFKNFNDMNGHPAGDEVLRQMAKLLSRREGEKDSESKIARREADIVARYGGEEFVMILPFTPHEGALVKAERIRSAVESYAFEHREKQPLGFVSVSMGVATYPEHGKTPADLIEAADKALYAAKEDGRNQWKSAGPLDRESVSEKAAVHEVRDASSESLGADPQEIFANTIDSKVEIQEDMQVSSDVFDQVSETVRVENLEIDRVSSFDPSNVNLEPEISSAISNPDAQSSEGSSFSNVFSEMASVFDDSQEEKSQVIEDSSEQVDLVKEPVSEVQVAPTESAVSEAQTAPDKEAVPAMANIPVIADLSVSSDKDEKQKHISRVANPLWRDDIAFDDFLIKEPEAPVSEDIAALKFDDQPMATAQADLPKIDLGQLIENIKQVVEEPKTNVVDNPFEMKKIKV